MGGVEQKRMSGQRLYRPALQNEHTRQGTPGSIATLSPEGGGDRPGDAELDSSGHT